MAIKDWHHPSGIKHVWEKNGRWVSWGYYKGKELPYIVDTIKMGMLDILGRFKTKAQALHLVKQYLETH